ncbi:glucose-1-phosphate cytidylyltransferase [Cecembia sp.]|uniref:glucose-1-phosphate cytidylyltransferase n=1 Tax=Cecembia sp. TaxID=1898110 RepID=UPI0025C436CA|nr:glucose-1-phosphate cytidylyltransferase [Cecembia sp.]
MKAVILAGGYGTRISEETSVKPKPMVRIGRYPILWHILKHYSYYHIRDFIICCGYKGEMIKEFFLNYHLMESDFSIDLQDKNIEIINKKTEPWKITLVDTGEHSMTGGRLKRVREYVGDNTFCMTYGDGLSDVNLDHLIRFHKNQQTLATLTAVRPPGRFGVFKLDSEQTRIHSFLEKPNEGAAWINGGFFVLEAGIFDYLESDSTVWEKEPLENLSRNGELSAFKHTGFWQPMDTLRDKHYLQQLWESDDPPWKIWT